MALPLLEPLIDELSTKERKDVQLWLDCPLHNRREDVKILFRELCCQFPTTAPDSKIAPLKAATTDQRLTRSYLLDRIEHYLCWRYRQDRSGPDLDLLLAYRNRGMQHHLNNRLNRKRGYRNEQCDPRSLLTDYYFEELLQDQNSDRERSNRPDFERPDQLLLLAQTSARLRQAALNLAGAGFSGRAPELPLLQEYLKLVEEEEALLMHPGISLYYHLCRWQLPSEEQELLPFGDLVNLLKANLERFPATEQSTLLKLLLNLAIRRVNRDAAVANLRPAYELYTLGLEEGLLLEGGVLSNFAFNNYVGISLRLGEIDAARNCLNNYAELLSPKSIGEVMALNRARLAYAAGDLRESVFLLQQADYRDTVHLMNARGLHLRIYYELGEIEPMLDLLRATTTQISRRQLGYHEKVFKNNLRLMRKLAKLNPRNSDAVQALKQEIETTHPLTDREWLLSKLQ